MMCERKVGAFSLPCLPFDSFCPPTELLILVEVFRGSRDTTESVRNFIPHSRVAEGMGSPEERSRVAGPQTHWEGTELGKTERASDKGLLERNFM
jgi:hypothetical protein